MAPQVQLLRDFRDTYLLPSRIGRVVVHGYYAVSPPLAQGIGHSAGLRAVTRFALLPVVGWASLALWSPAAGLGAALLPMVAGIWLMGRRARRR